MESKNYYTDRRSFVIRFVFRYKSDAREFTLPRKYRDRFELNNIIGEDDNDFVRVAQIKLEK